VAFRALRAAAVAIWIVKAAISNTPRTVKTLFRILVSLERALLKTTAPGLFAVHLMPNAGIAKPSRLIPISDIGLTKI
jgi:hypothetical protein